MSLRSTDFLNRFLYWRILWGCNWQIPELHGKLNSPHLDELPPLMRMLILLWKPGRNLRCQLANAIERAHIHNANYDVKKKNMLVTAEDESGIHIWDLRKHKFPVKELPGHTWIWVVTCNPECNGLILSAGTDSTVNLWLAPASAGDESTSESIAESPTQQADPLHNSYGDYEDSVYGLA
ncbi:WD repeat-containing protein DWA2-like [Durio zibethinus]|uniref:WD repeat-containing protein DWA2-like n=1 Tax=Durio zibethinus TaxID=66656 RepID=A0A6P6B5X0_DURZI|nr:WD repeat-containing protein DWA2-like [Durio zibethinus]